MDIYEFWWESLCKLSLLCNRKFDLISQSGWSTLTCALSKLPISTSKDSGSLVIIVMAVTRGRGKRHDDRVRETKYTSAGVLSSFSDKDLFFYQSNIAIDNVIEYFFWQLLTFVAACLSFLSSECVSVCLFSLTDLNLFYLTLLEGLDSQSKQCLCTAHRSRPLLANCSPRSDVNREDTGNDEEIFPYPVTWPGSIREISRQSDYFVEVVINHRLDLHQSEMGRPILFQKSTNVSHFHAERIKFVLI